MKHVNTIERTGKIKKAVAFIIALCLAAGLCACGGPSDGDIKAVRDVSFTGTELTVTLGTNKSTGYEWDYEIFGECIEPSVDRSFKVTGGSGDATGEVSIGFNGTSEGSAVIVFTTPNGWDGTGDGDAYTVNVVVGANGTIEKANGMEGAFPVETSAEPASEPTPEPAAKTSVAIAELAEGTYTGTMPGADFVNNTNTVFTTVLPADITVTVESGQITLYCEAVCSAYGMLDGVKTPESPEGSVIFSGSLPLAKSGDTVTADGELPILGEKNVLHHNDMKFDGWTLEKRDGNSVFDIAVDIVMTDGVPVATVTAAGTALSRTATVPLALKGDDTSELLSAPYAEMLISGNYQYSYPMTSEGVDFIITVAVQDDMYCRAVESQDGTFHQRVLGKDGKAYQIDELTGAVQELGAEGYEAPTDYAGTLTFVAAKTLETGAVAEAYDYEYQGKPCNVVFVFSKGKLVEFVVTIDGTASEIFVTDMSGVPDTALFDIPQ